MKTPEQMAEEYAEDWHKDCDYPEEILKHTIKATKTTFLAGYKAGQEHPFQFQTKMWVDPIGPQYRWISVKDRLPEEDEKVKILINFFLEGTEVREVTKAAFRNGLWSGEGVHITHPLVSHWMPLPKPPEDK